MRRSLAAAAAVALTSLAGPAGAVAVWQGDATITAVNGPCASSISERQTIGVGTTLRVLFRPAGVSTNGNDTRFSFNHDAQANMEVILPSVPAGTYAAFGVKYDGMLVANHAAAYSRFVSVQPVAADTVFVEYVGTVSDFMFITGCTVNFRAAMTPKP